MEMQFSIATMHVKTYGVLYFKVFWIGIKKMGQKSTSTVLYEVMEDYIWYIYSFSCILSSDFISKRKLFQLIQTVKKVEITGDNDKKPETKTSTMQWNWTVINGELQD